MACLVISGCSGVKSISAGEFIRELCEGAGAKNTFWSTKFVGVKDGLAYLKYWDATPEMLGGGGELHAVEMSKLPVGFNPDAPLNVCGK